MMGVGAVQRMYLMLVLVMMVSLGGQLWWCDGCLEEERIALLQIKHSFGYPNGSSLQLRYWGDDAACCSWDRIYCNTTTGRVTVLYLWDLRDGEPGDWYLNASLFLPFKQLNHLFLMRNAIAGCIENEGFERLSKLANLESLHLGYNNFNNSILPSLATLSSLKHLYLYNNRLKGSISIQEFNQQLETLDLGFNEIEGLKSVHAGEALVEFSNLKSLYLGYTKLKGLMNLKELDAFSNLEWLDLSGNDINEFVASRGLSNLSVLELSNITMYERSVQLLQQSLRAFPNLRTLYLFDNNFKETIFGLHNLSCSIEALFLDGSSLDENALQSLAAIPSLKNLSMSYLKGGLPSQAFPKFLYYRHNLELIDLSSNRMEGELLINWLLENNTNLRSLSLANNSLSGFFQLPTHPIMNLSSLDISHNHFHGRLPTEIGAYFPRLSFLSISNNGFDGCIPSSFGNMSTLEVLDLSNNNLSGEIPMHLAMGCSLLEALILSKNKLEGQIFSTNIGLKDLVWLQLDDNRFTGGIPSNLLNCSVLRMLDVSDNNLSGGIPEWMRNLSSLEHLDLSRNIFSGSLPNSLSPSQLLYVHLSRNRIQGSWTNAFSNCSKLAVLDLGHNFLTGTIPGWINRLSHLTFLLLNHNNFNGEIPIQLCELDQLSLLDLSHNSLSGRILACLRFNNGDLLGREEDFSAYELPFNGTVESLKQSLEFTVKSTSLSYEGSILRYISGVDFSCNNFTGKIPSEIGHLANIEALNLSHNNLIGPIPPTFAYLRKIESLDLSCNKLNGKIPPQLIALNFLAAFNVSHNNLSGKIPDRVAQFATFEENSYKDNPFLCGLPLPKSCSAEISPLPLPGISTDEEDDGFMDMNVFYVTFVVTYIMVVIGIAAVLYINPNWRRVWFYFMEVSINNCYYFLVDNLCILSKIRFW